MKVSTSIEEEELHELTCVYHTSIMGMIKRKKNLFEELLHDFRWNRAMRKTFGEAIQSFCHEVEN